MNNARSSNTFILPERQNGGKRMLVLGYSCRCALAFICLFGFSLFLNDALALELTLRFQLTACLLPILWLSLMGINRALFFGAGAAGAAVIAILLASTARLSDVIECCAASMSNAYFRRLIALGYDGQSPKLYALGDLTKQLRKTEGECRRIAFAVIMLLLAVLICCCILRRTHLLPLLLVGGCGCGWMLYLGMPDKNTGFAVLLAALCGVVALYGYDGIYAKRRVLADRLSLTRRSASERVELRHAVRVNASLGGFTGLSTALLALALLAFPMQLEQGMSDIPTISTPVLKLESYITALANGQSPDLQSLLLSGAVSLDSRSTLSSDRTYTGEPVFEVLTDSSVPIYLRSWVGLDYYDDSWHSPSYDRIAEYKRIFGDGFSPELLTFELLSILDPTLASLPEMRHYSPHTELGYITMQVHLRKLTPTANLLFLPSYTDPRQGLMKFGEREPLNVGYSSYCDGIFTGSAYMFLDDYSVIANVPLLRDAAFAERLGKMMEDFMNESAYIHLIRAISQDGGSQKQLRQTYETMRKSLDSPDSLAHRYAYDMTEEERASVHAVIDNLELYNEYVYQSYLTGCEDFYNLELLAKKITKGLGYQSAAPVTAEAYSYRHKQVMAVIDYLSENMTYTLTPDPPSRSKAYKNAVSTFLFDTNEGYCVQFASAACMLLRSLGIPTRYAEGYIANQFNRLSSENAAARYTSTVQDKNAHAWIEVYYDYYGWIQYEATAPYYSEMYEEPQTPTIEPIDYSTGEVTTYTPPELDSQEPPTLDPDTSADKEDGINHTAVVIVFAAAIISVLAISLLKLRSMRYEKRISAAIDMAARSDGSSSTDARLELAATLNDAILRLLSLKGLVPIGGERQRDFALRVDKQLGTISEYSFEQVSRAMLAGEFSRDISPAELHCLAAYLRDLTDSTMRDAGYFEHIRLKYFYLPS